MNLYKVSKEDYQVYCDKYDSHILAKWISFRHKDYEDTEHRIYYEDIVTADDIDESGFEHVYRNLDNMRGWLNEEQDTA